MANQNLKKAALQTAATESYSKAGPAMKQAEPQLAKPSTSGAKPPKAGGKDSKPR